MVDHTYQPTHGLSVSEGEQDGKASLGYVPDQGQPESYGNILSNNKTNENLKKKSNQPKQTKNFKKTDLCRIEKRKVPKK